MKYPDLFARFEKLAALPEAQWLRAEGLAKERALAKRAFFVRPGDPADRFGFVLAGVFRVFRLSAGGEESVKAFRSEGELVGPYAEILERLPSRTGVQALEPGRLLMFRLEDLETLEAGHPAWGMVARRVAEQHYLEKERREQELLDLSAEERYRQLAAARPDLLRRVPQHEIAAYLGVTAVGLSRIVSRLRR